MEFHAQYTIYLQHFSLGSASILLLTAATYIFLKKGWTAKVIYVSSVISVLSMFAIAINTTILSSEYNITRNTERNNPHHLSVMHFYRMLQVESAIIFLLCIPSMLYVLYQSLNQQLADFQLNPIKAILSNRIRNTSNWIQAICVLNSFVLVGCKPLCIQLLLIHTCLMLSKTQKITEWIILQIHTVTTSLL